MSKASNKVYHPQMMTWIQLHHTMTNHIRVAMSNLIQSRYIINSCHFKIMLFLRYLEILASQNLMLAHMASVPTAPWFPWFLHGVPCRMGLRKLRGQCGQASSKEPCVGRTQLRFPKFWKKSAAILGLGKFGSWLWRMPVCIGLRQNMNKH